MSSNLTRARQTCQGCVGRTPRGCTCRSGSSSAASTGERHEQQQQQQYHGKRNCPEPSTPIGVEFNDGAPDIYDDIDLDDPETASSFCSSSSNSNNSINNNNDNKRMRMRKSSSSSNNSSSSGSSSSNNSSSSGSSSRVVGGMSEAGACGDEAKFHQAQ